MDIKPIRTERDYEQALDEIDRLFDAQPGTPEGNKLEVLALLVEDYERTRFPASLPDPIAAIEYWMEMRGLTRRDLEPYIGSRGRVAEVLNRKRALTLKMIQELVYHLGIPAEILIQSYSLLEDPPGSETGTWFGGLREKSQSVYGNTRSVPSTSDTKHDSRFAESANQYDEAKVREEARGQRVARIERVVEADRENTQARMSSSTQKLVEEFFRKVPENKTK